MPNLTYELDKRTPHDKLTSSYQKYNLSKTKKISYIIAIPSNFDANIKINRYTYGFKRISTKLKLLRFYLNKTTFENYNNIPLMTDVIKTIFGVEKFIITTFTLITKTPELFTINKAQFIVSYLLDLAFNLIDDSSLHNKDTYNCYATLLGYLERDRISQEIYGVEKSIIAIAPLNIRNSMNNKLVDLIKTINIYLRKENNLHKIHKPPTVEENEELIKTLSNSYKENFNDDNINTIIEEIATKKINPFLDNDPDNDSDNDSDNNDPDNDSDNNDSDNDFDNKSKNEFLDIDLPDNSKSVEQPQQPKLITPIYNDRYKHFVDSEDEEEPLPPPIPSTKFKFDKYIDNSIQLTFDDLFIKTPNLSEAEKTMLESVLKMIQRIRQDCGILISKDYKDNSKYYRMHKKTDNILNVLPVPIRNLMKKYSQYLSIAGGYIFNYVNEIKDIYSDIDIFISKMPDEKYKEFIKDLKLALELLDVTHMVRCIQRRSVITIASKLFHNIQFIRTDMESNMIIADNFDIDACKVSISCINTYWNSVAYPRIYKNPYNFQKIIPIRFLKYLAKGCKLYGDDNSQYFKKYERDMIHKLAKICTENPEKIIKNIKKKYITIGKDNLTEDEIKKEMIANLDASNDMYIGNDFKKLDLKPFKSFKKSYYNNNIVDNIPMVNLLTMKPEYYNLIKMAASKQVSKCPVSYAKTQMNYYFPLTVYGKNMKHDKDINCITCILNNDSELIKTITDIENKIISISNFKTLNNLNRTNSFYKSPRNNNLYFKIKYLSNNIHNIKFLVDDKMESDIEIKSTDKFTFLVKLEHLYCTDVNYGFRYMLTSPIYKINEKYFNSNEICFEKNILTLPNKELHNIKMCKPYTLKNLKLTIVKPDENNDKYYFPMILSGKDIIISYYCKNSNSSSVDFSKYDFIRFYFDITNLNIYDKLNEMAKHFFEREEYKPINFINTIPQYKHFALNPIMTSNNEISKTNKYYLNTYIHKRDNIDIMKGITLEEAFKKKFEFNENKKYLVRIKIKQVWYSKNYYRFAYILDCPIQEVETSDLNKSLVIEEINNTNNNHTN
jgi:hypothetical protein